MDRREARVLRKIRRGWRQWPSLVRCVHGRRLRATLRRLALTDMQAVKFLGELGDDEGLQAVVRQFLGARDAEEAMLLGYPLSEVLEPIAAPALRETLVSGPSHVHLAAAYWHRDFPSDATAAALIATIEDKRQTVEVRENAIESLRYCDQRSCREAVLACLIGRLKDPDPIPRFWAVYSLCMDRRAIPHLEAMVNDRADEGCMWSVGREAQAILEQFGRIGMRTRGCRRR